jgi:hypothetical protein
MGKSLTEVAKSILMNENANMATLKPGGGAKDGVEPSPMSNQATLVGDAPKKPGEGDNVGAKAATMKQDTSQASPSRKGVVPAMPPQKEVMEEDVEIEEENIEEAMGDSNVRAGIKTVQGNAAPKSHPLTPAIGEKSKMGSSSTQSMKEEEELEEEIELSEELEAFIDQCLEEGLSEEEIVAAIDENFELISEEELEEEKVEYDYEVDMNEHVEALFAGEDLSEEFKQKAVTIFEAAVVAKMQSEIARLEEAYAATLEEEVETLKEELSSNVDDYLNYVVEQWVSDNEVAIEAGLRTELTEDFISGLRQLFAENYIDIPEDKISVVEEFGSKIEELEAKLNEEIARNVELTSILSESKKTEVLHAMTEGLTATQAEKLKQLAEGVEFVDVDTFATKVQTLRENYFPSSVNAQTELDKIEPGTEGQTMISEENNPMSKYVRVLGKTLPKK